MFSKKLIKMLCRIFNSKSHDSGKCKNIKLYEVKYGKHSFEIHEKNCICDLITANSKYA